MWRTSSPPVFRAARAFLQSPVKSRHAFKRNARVFVGGDCRDKHFQAICHIRCYHRIVNVADHRKARLQGVHEHQTLCLHRRAAVAVAPEKVAALDDEVGDDPVEGRAVVEAGADQALDAADVVGGDVGAQLDRDPAAGRASSPSGRR